MTVKYRASRSPKASNIEWSASAPWIRITGVPLPLCLKAIVVPLASIVGMASLSVQKRADRAGQRARRIGRDVGHAPGDMAVGPHQHRAAWTHVNAIGRMRVGQLLQV